MLPVTPVRVFTLVLCLATVASGQQRDLRLPPPSGKPAVEKTGPTTYRLGPLSIDTAKREVTATGRINDVSILEFVANTAKGFKAYESAMTIDADAISYNAALLLIGLDPSRARVPTAHFDPKPPEGDPVEILIEWSSDAGTRRAPVEELLWDERTKATMPPGPWIYTGSTFIDLVDHKEFLAQSDGVLIGFVHSPAPLIENPRPGAVNNYGAVVLNKNLGLKPGTPITLIVRALPRK